MYKKKLITGVLLSIMLLIVAGCQAESVTTTMITTTTIPAQTVTATSTVTPAPQTQTVIITTTTTITTTISEAETTTPASTTTSGFAPISSPDGKLQIVDAELVVTGIADFYVRGEVINLSDDVLSARITVEFLNDIGVVEQTAFATINDLDPGEQKTFTAYSPLSFVPLVDFNISVEVVS